MKKTQKREPIQPGLRVPRPMGLTYLLSQYQKNPGNEEKVKIQELLMHHYVSQGFSINGQSMSLESFSVYSEINLPTLNQKLYDTSAKLSNFQDPVHIANIASTLISLTTNWSLKNHGEILNQIEIMKKAQGGRYVPFISSTMNQTLELALKSNKNLTELFKTFQTAPTENPIQAMLNMFMNKGHHEENQDVLTPDKALQIIQENIQDSKTQYNSPESMEDISILKAHNIKPLDQLGTRPMLTEKVELPPIDVSKLPKKKRRREVDDKEVSSL